MKVLVVQPKDNDEYLHFTGLSKALAACNHDVTMWDSTKKPAFDAFDELEPDILLVNNIDITESIIKCIQERPQLRILLQIDDGCAADIPVDLAFTTVKDREINDLIWLPKAADIFRVMPLAPKIDAAFEVSCVQDHSCKNGLLNRLCDIRLCIPINIFGKYGTGVNYCGEVGEAYLKHIWHNSTISLFLHKDEKNSYQQIFDMLLCGAFVICNSNNSTKFLLKDNVVFFNDEAELIELVRHYIKYKNERLPMISRGPSTIIESHTYFHRLNTIFTRLSMDKEASRTIDRLEDIKKAFGIRTN